MHRRKRVSGFAGLVSLGTLACIGCVADASDISSADVEISGEHARTDTNVNPEWPQVVSLGNCSGTIITPVHVLTAGHCGTPAKVRVDTPQRSGWGSSWYRTYNVIQTHLLSSSVGSGSDIQLLLLDHDVRSDGQPGAPIWRIAPAAMATALDPTSPHTAVGYGKSCPLPGVGFGARRWVEMPGDFTVWPGGQVTFPNTTPCDETYVGPQPGDSGGALFDGDGRVVGVFSGWFARGGVGTIEWTDVTTSANRNWILGRLIQDFDGDGIVDQDDRYPGVVSWATDGDGDGVPDPIDNHPGQANADQLDPTIDGRWVSQLMAVM